MKYSLFIVFFLSSLFTSLASCKKEASLPSNPDTEDTNSNNTLNPTGSQMRIKIGSSTFTATLYDNATATAFKALLPMTITMSELNGNEKYFDLADNLPATATNPGTIQNGDLMLYGSNTLVLFYKSFSTSYRYTKLGRINDTSGLAAALGSGNVLVTFELE
ncbi:hypothetical protein GXP67_00080 [Rhodocytophaga rosea]|uniref:Cyclophilin-like domain-containing protein n=1 Tax=Rhodocytophaga rosea TaxID=2704465 RepID=A0A6C0GBG1_9BACT|nr:cyclophilin-like fold protein [Rhodocytophaga rosea]QHT65183.1 hypothetical protein GXP67_00080 [Rhodocytophaga rosea]